MTITEKTTDFLAKQRTAQEEKVEGRNDGN
jgi:hypothetical protein